jgi:Zn/Cd-binding protein ZinT
MVYFSVFELSEKDKDTMLKSCGKENYKETIRNLVYLDHSQAISQKFRRKLPEMTAEEFNDYLRKHSQATFDIIKCEPNIVKLLRQMHAQTLDQNAYPYIKDKPVKSLRGVQS